MTETRTCECGKHTLITSPRPLTAKDYRPLCHTCFTRPASAEDWQRA